ncbi:hypothetical protein AAMO2058_001118000 [Amorphochlora amoebiformis]
MELQRKKLEKLEKRWALNRTQGGPMALGVGPSHPSFGGGEERLGHLAANMTYLNRGLLGISEEKPNISSITKRPEQTSLNRIPEVSTFTIVDGKGITRKQWGKGSDETFKLPTPTAAPSPLPMMDRVVFTGYGTVVDMDKLAEKQESDKPPDQITLIRRVLEDALRTAKNKLADGGILYPPAGVNNVDQEQREFISKRILEEENRRGEREKRELARERRARRRQHMAKDFNELKRLQRERKQQFDQLSVSY